nr:hypothetical protein TetV2_00028 [Oceanusvirus sp.]
MGIPFRNAEPLFRIIEACSADHTITIDFADLRYSFDTASVDSAQIVTFLERGSIYRYAPKSLRTVREMVDDVGSNAVKLRATPEMEVEREEELVHALRAACPDSTVDVLPSFGLGRDMNGNLVA